MRRPIRKGHRMCAQGCVCAQQQEDFYDSCASKDDDYLYTQQMCRPVYKIASADDASFLDRGISYHYTPLDTVSFDKPLVLGPSGFDSYCSDDTAGSCGLTAGVQDIDGFTYNIQSPQTLSFTQSPAFMTTSISNPGTPFSFYGSDYNQVTIFDDGYLCFGTVAGTPSYKDGTYDAHFGGGYACFSFLQTGLGTSSGYSFKKCHKDKKTFDSTWEEAFDNFTNSTNSTSDYAAFVSTAKWETASTTFTFENVPLEGSNYLNSPATATVQVALIFPNEIRVSYKNIPASITAIIGPSNGNGLHSSFVPSKLPRK